MLYHDGADGDLSRVGGVFGFDEVGGRGGGLDIVLGMDGALLMLMLTGAMFMVVFAGVVKGK
jgi:hypothetical protein